MDISGRQCSKQLRLVLSCFALFLGAQACLYGQTLNGSLVGVVTDPSGAVIPNAAVTATDVDTAQKRQETTDQ
ncbi:MAG TPA: carboxypeptidase-like regulatory domain-containing protein, partial [Bryobacteraceae bacterium]|nr:carboxypeptidase-like regulatory domain-containing protein [Bryobacteraceae bacterium]